MDPKQLQYSLERTRDKDSERYFIALLLLVPLTNLLVAPSLIFPFVTGRNFFFRVVIDLMVILFVAGILKQRVRAVPTGPIAICLAGLVLWESFATLTGIDPFHSFFGNFERMGGLLGLLHVYLLAFLLAASIKEEKIWFCFFNVTAATSFAVAVIVGAQQFEILPVQNLDGRPDGSFGNPAQLAIFALANTFICGFLWANQRSQELRILFVFGILINVLLVIVSGTRGTVFAAIVGWSVVLTLKDKFFRIYILPLLVFGVVGLCLAAVELLLNASSINSEKIIGIGRLTEYTPAELGTRIALWRHGLEAIAESPIFGFGPGQFVRAFDAFYLPGAYGADRWFDSSHNIFLDYGVSGGIPSFIFYVGIYIFTFNALWWSTSSKILFTFNEKCLFTGFFVGYAVQGFFTFETLPGQICFFSILSFVIWRTKSVKEIDFGNSATIQTITAGSFSLILICFLSYALTAKPLLLAIKLGSFDVEKIESKAGDAAAEKKWFTQLEEAFEGATTGKLEAAEELVFAMQSYGEVPISDALRQELELYAMALDDTRFLMFLAFTVAEKGYCSSAMNLAERGSGLSPRNPHVQLRLGEIYTICREPEAAIRAIDRSSDLIGQGRKDRPSIQTGT